MTFSLKKRLLLINGSWRCSKAYPDYSFDQAVEKFEVLIRKFLSATFITVCLDPCLYILSLNQTQ